MIVLCSVRAWVLVELGLLPALPRSAPAPPPATVVPITPEPLVDGGDDHADGPPKDLDKQAKVSACHSGSGCSVLP